jgi:hypothetical protein
MTLRVWLVRLGRFLSGRAGLEHQSPRPEIPPIELPDIAPARGRPTPDGREKEHLERKKAEHDRELARLRAIVRARSTGRDA